MTTKRLITMLLTALLTATAAIAGTWRQHGQFLASSIQNVYDAGDKVYYQNCNTLFQFDKATCQTTSLGRHNGLCQNTVRQLYYDWENRMLFVSYDDSNIDVIDRHGTVTNIPNVKNYVARVHNANLDDDNYLVSYSDKEIHDITFAGGTAYVAIGFGYVTIDEATLQPTRFVELGKSITVNSVVVTGDMMIIASNAYFYFGTIGQENPIQNYHRKTANLTGSRMLAIDGTSVFVLNPTLGALYHYEFLLNNATATATKLVAATPTSVQKTPTGFIANFAGSSFYYTIDATGRTATQASASAGFASCDPLGDGTVWINDGNGLHTSGSSTAHAANALSMSSPYWLKYNAAMNKLYVANSAPNLLNITSSSTSNVIDTYDGTTWKRTTPYSSTGSGYEFVLCPSDPKTYVRASWSSGVHKVRNDALVSTYNQNNALMGKYKAQPAFDKYGNLWVVSSYKSDEHPVAVLPKNKFDKTACTVNDWFAPEGLLRLNTGSMQGSRFIISKKNNVKFYCDGNLSMGLVTGSITCFDNHNDDPTAGRYDFANYNSFFDQNGIPVGWLYVKHMEEDNDGTIWVGHDGGLFAFDPDEAFKDHPRCHRPHVSNPDNSTSIVLCEVVAVYDLGIDRGNNKWIATGGNGLYYVSPDGTEVYEHFTTANSDIPSDIVYCVECDTVNNRVFIVTPSGVAEYAPGEDGCADSFAGLYVYPDRVTPDFTGYIEINGLMAGSYVTVTDRGHNVVAKLGPVSGQALWDGCGANGDRVPTGVYNVYAAQGASPDVTGAPLATVLIVK